MDPGRLHSRSKRGATWSLRQMRGQLYGQGTEPFAAALQLDFGSSAEAATSQHCSAASPRVLSL
jgi:hypothetical protein